MENLPTSIPFAGWAHTQPPQIDAARDVPSVEPLYRVKLPGVDFVRAIEISPDGKKIYCSTERRQVDLWAATVSIWPELLGVGVVLVVVLWVLLLIRTKRRPQVHGDPHCRKCNYNVKIQAPDSVKPGQSRRLPLAGVKCPECGVELLANPPRRGRTLSRRLAPLTAVALVSMVFYASLWIIGIGRIGYVSKLFYLRSDWVYRHAKKHKIKWLLKHVALAFDIMELDARTGKITRSVLSWPDVIVTELRCSSDGKFLVFGDFSGPIHWLNTATGIVASSTPTTGFRDGVGRFMADRTIVGIDGDPGDPWVYFALADQKEKVSRLFRWRPATGQKEIVVEEPAFGLAAAGGTSYVPRMYALLHWASGTATASAADSTEWFYSPNLRHEIIIRAPSTNGGAILRTIDPAGGKLLGPQESDSAGVLLAKSDGSVVFTSVNRVISGVDPRDGRQLGLLNAESGRGDPGLWVCPIPKESALSEDGTRLFVPVEWFVPEIGQAILVRDLARRAWSGRLNLASNTVADHVAVSRDGQCLAVMTTAMYSPQGDKCELFIYDLYALNPPTTQPRAPK